MGYYIVKADLNKNKLDILGLWKRNFPDMPEHRYQWIYKDNPMASAECWLAKNSEQDGVIGATTLFPRRIFINGKPFSAGIAGDFAIDKGHRGFGPAMLLQKAAISYCDGEHFNVLYGFPNKQAEAVLLRAGYKVLGDVVRMTKPLRSYYQIKRRIGIPAVTKIISKPVDLAMAAFSRERHFKKPFDYTVETPSFFDSRFDGLWSKASAQFHIIGERSSTYLNWRYIKSPHKNYRVFALTSKKNIDILGYVVFNITDNKTYIDDLICINMDEALDVLLSEFLLLQRKEGTDSVSISYMGAETFVDKLKKYGFSVRDREGKTIWYAASDSPNLSYFQDKERWHLLPCDNDV